MALVTESLELYDGSTTLFTDTWQVRVHELIGRGVAEARRRKGLTQEQAARRFQGRGLRTWRKGTVGQLEAGLRRPGLDEVLLMASALEVTVDQLIPGEDDERVELGDGATVSPRWIREMLTGELHRDTPRPLADMPYAQFPVHKVMAEVMHRLGAEENRAEALLAPILKWAEQHNVKLTSEDWEAIFDTPSDTERHAARRLGIEVTQLKLSARVLAARVLWGLPEFDDERDRRVGNLGELEPRSRQAHRGLVTRQMLTELWAFLDEVYVRQEGDSDGER
jgi:transcriptional regulator with XRE-family HTH domain